MKSWIEPLKGWFGYTRRERRSTFILLIIIVIVFGIRLIVPDHSIPVEEIPVNISDTLADEPVIAGAGPSVPVRKKAVVQNLSSVRKGPQKFHKQLTELNSCDTASLVALPGIGPVLSVRIVKYRNLLGGFVNVGQLREVYGLSEESFNMISSKVTVDSLLVKKIRINEADFKTLIRHPYFRKEEVQGIIKYRELEGKIGGLNEMVKNNIISNETAKKIRTYVDFGE
jgi:DNA uptake protein ComE-like DNA-binding protein